MIRRVLVLGIALSTVSFSVATADEPLGREDIVIPPSRPAAPAAAAVTAPPPAWVEMETRSIAAGIGIHWGEGVIVFEGERHEFALKGVSLIDVGAVRISAEGGVQNLENLADFEGNYVAVEASAAAGVGVGTIAMRNEKGVVINLESDLEGVGLTLGTQGFSIALK